MTPKTDPSCASLYETLTPLVRKEISVESLTENLFHGKLVHVSKPAPSKKNYITIQDVLEGKTHVLLDDIGRVWQKNKILWRMSRLKK